MNKKTTSIKNLIKIINHLKNKVFLETLLQGEQLIPVKGILFILNITII